MRGIAYGRARAAAGSARQLGAGGATLRLTLLALAVATMAGCGDEPTAPRRAVPSVPALRPAAAVTFGTPVAPTPLATLDGPDGTALDINDSGVVVGYLNDASGTRRVARWPAGAGPALISVLARVLGVTADGAVGGVPSESSCRVAVWHPARGLTLAPAGQPTENACLTGEAISDSGRYLVGFFNGAPTGMGFYDLTHPFAWVLSPYPYPGLVVHDVGPTNSTWKYGVPHDVSDRSLLVGEVSYPPQRRQAAAWRPGVGIEYFGPPCIGSGAVCNSAAYGVNDAGTIVGQQDGRPVRFDGGIRALLPAEMTGNAVDVNDKGEILLQVGSAAYLLRGSVLVPLGTLADGGSVTVYKVNERSQVAGSAADGAGRQRPVIWDVDAAPAGLVVSPGGPYTAEEGAAVAFHGAASGGTPPYTFRWSLSDGAELADSNPTHAFVDDGTFTATLQVSDAAGRTQAQTIVVTIVDRPPLATQAPDWARTAYSGDSMHLRFYYTDAGVNDGPWSWQWYTPDSIVRFERHRVPDTLDLALRATRPGSFEWRIAVTDRANRTMGWNLPYEVLPIPLSMALVPGTLKGASDGEGFLAATLLATPTMRPGDLDVTSIVIAAAGHAVSVARDANDAPLARLADANGDGLPDLELQFSRRALLDAGLFGGDPSHGIPAGMLVLSGRTPDARYVEARTQLRLTDPPVVVLTGAPYAGTEGAPVSFGATVSGGAAPVALRWTLGDGATADGASATHAYQQDGGYTVTLTATDADGERTTATAMATIANVAPSVSVEAGAIIYSGDSWTLRGQWSDPGVADAPWRWSVQWGDGVASDEGTSSAPSDGVARTATLRRAGQHVVTLRVSDKDGGAGSAAAVVEVRRLPVPVSAAPPKLQAVEHGRGLLTVVVEGTERVSVAEVDPVSVRLAGVALAARGAGGPMATLEDVDGDGASELVLRFERAALATGKLRDATLVLQADLRDGRQVEGRAMLTSKGVVTAEAKRLVP